MQYLPKPKSFHLQWHITDKCNFNCKHCYRDVSVSDLNLEQLCSILEQYVELIKTWGLNGKTKLSLTGGEPLLREDFFELLKKIYEKRHIGFSYYLMSNGSTITRPVAKKLKKLYIGGVQVSLDGLEESNDFIRGAGNFKKAVRGAEILVKEHVPVFFSMTVNKKI